MSSASLFAAGAINMGEQCIEIWEAIDWRVQNLEGHVSKYWAYIDLKKSDYIKKVTSSGHTTC